MDTKKTVLVSILTTLGTLLVVAAIVRLTCGGCGGQKACNTSKECYTSSCKKACDKEKTCSKGKAGCEKKTCKFESNEDGTKTTVTYTKDGDKKIIKKIVKKETEE